MSDFDIFIDNEALRQLKDSSKRIEKLTKWLIALTVVLAIETIVLIARTFV